MKMNKKPINTYFLFVATCILCILFITISISIKIFRTKNTYLLTSSINNENENNEKSKCYACEKQTCNKSLNGGYPSKCYDCERKSKTDSTIEYIMKYPTSTPKMTYV
jgi:hypothetical protein